MPGDPLKVFEGIDPEPLKLVRQALELALASGALHRKVKLYLGEGS